MNLPKNWLAPPSPLSLKEDEVHIWQVSLDQPYTTLQQLRQVLSGDELARAKRFHFDKDRNHYIVARGTLRLILGDYLNTEPGHLRFSYSDHGKPTLDPPSDLVFNVSHSGGVALHAVTRGREIGVDIEKVRPMADGEQIAERFFSAEEVEVFLHVPPDQRDEAFFNCWTRKEAYIKAIGEGLSHPLDTFIVSLKPGEPAALLQVKDTPQEVDRWSLYHFEPRAGYIGAVMAEGQALQLRYFIWSC